MLDFSKLRLTQPILAGSGAELGKNARKCKKMEEYAIYREHQMELKETNFVVF
jgi:hypothetical protein